jgi:hypothetical protein
MLVDLSSVDGNNTEITASAFSSQVSLPTFPSNRQDKMNN